MIHKQPYVDFFFFNLVKSCIYNKQASQLELNTTQVWVCISVQDPLWDMTSSLTPFKREGLVMVQRLASGPCATLEGTMTWFK